MSIVQNETPLLNDGEASGASRTPAPLLASGENSAGAPPAVAFASLLPQITPAVAQATRVLFDARLGRLVARVPGITEWHLTPVTSAADSPAPLDELGRIVLAHVTGNISVDVDLRCYPALQILAPAAHVNATDAGAAQLLRQSIANVLLAPLTEILLETGVGTWRVADVMRINRATTSGHKERQTGASTGGPNGDDSIDNKLVASVSVTFNGCRHDARLHIGPALLTLLERRLVSLQASRSPDAPANDRSTLQPCTVAASHPSWRVPGRITIGMRRIAIAALEAMRPGDVLLRTMPTHIETALSLGNAFRARAAWGTPGLTRLYVGVEIDDCKLVIIEDPIMTDEPQQPDDDYPPLDNDFHDEPIEIGELDLPVQFELDSIALPLAQLSSLRPGYIIELDTPVLDAPVRLVAHGQTLGYGELVAVAERLGIRILKMAHSDGSA